MEQPNFNIGEQGQLIVDFGLFNHQFIEPLCCECNEPIQWVLDMFSFRSNNGIGYELGHARCLWTKDGFRTQEELAIE